MERDFVTYAYNRNRIEIMFPFEDELQKIMQIAGEKEPKERTGA